MESLTGERSFSAEFKIDDLVKRRNSIEFVWRNPAVTGGYSLWTKVRRKGKGHPWLGVRSRQGGIGTMRRWFFRGRGGGQDLPASFGGSSVRSPGLWASRPMLLARTARTPRPQQSLHPAPLHGRVTFRRKPESSYFEMFWTPVFAGVTLQKPLERWFRL
jgi:hypothetical protein